MVLTAKEMFLLSYELIESNLVYDGKIMEVYSDKVKMPNGQVASREYVVRGGGASAIVPIDEQGNIIFVKQYRHPIRNFTIEIPAGMLEKEEDPYECAVRELEEEIGFKSDDVKLITKMYSAVGICSEIIYIYLAKNLQPGHQHFDPDEFIEVEKHSVEEAVKMIFHGEITDSKTMVGVLAYQAMLKENIASH